MAPGAHVNVVGSSYDGPREIDDALVARARFFGDSKESVRAQGAEFRHALNSGAVSDSHLIGEIGEVLLGKVVGRKSDADITLYKSLGPYHPGYRCRRIHLSSIESARPMSPFKHLAAARLPAPGWSQVSLPARARKCSDQKLAVSTLTAASEFTPVSQEPRRFRSVTKHEIRVGGKAIVFDAIAGDTILRDMAGRPQASIFSFSYIRTNGASPDRPVLFVFNGGPGSASLWIHMGAIGPRRVVLDKEVDPSNTPPFGLEDNPYSILDVADLVFIDPVGTGFSRPAEGVDPKIFWGVDEDADSVAQFIELWLGEHGRWNSRKYVLGEKLWHDACRCPAKGPDGQSGL